MYTINANNVNEALAAGMALIGKTGEPIKSRVGDTLEVPMPVSTVYHMPWQKVLLSKQRDANPFFHLMEAMWILAGRSDVKFLSEFNKRIVNYSDDGIVFNAPYGYRMRSHFGTDQVQEVVNTLSYDNSSRQAVCQIWDPDDLPLNVKDKACNLGTVFRIRNDRLDITVFNRSNDMVWGAYGANVVQFSMLQEYVAAKLNIPVGTYTQVSNSFHVYTTGDGGKVWDRLQQGIEGDIVYPKKLVLLNNNDIYDFDDDLELFFKVYDDYGLAECCLMNTYKSQYFQTLVIPMLMLYLIYKNDEAIENRHLNSIIAEDWQQAALDWIKNRLEAKARKETMS